MSQKKPTKKKVVVTTQNKKKPTSTSSSKGKARPSTTRQRQPAELLFKKESYIWMIAGIVLIALGLFLMAGGAQPSPDVWDENVIYNWRRVTLAPFLILAGLGVEIYAIFKK
jgi:hypothetical protein